MNRATLPRPLKITQITVENRYTKTFTLDGSLEAQPGQFVMAWLPDMEDKPFSLANAAPVQLTIAAVGPLSEAIHQRSVGESIWVRGPLGKGYRLPDRTATAQHALLIGGGYGVAPLLFLARHLLAQGVQVSMVIGARSQAYLLLADAFRALEIPLWLTTEDGSAGLRGRVTDAIPRILRRSAMRPDQIYCCGPIGMLQAVALAGAAEQIRVQVAWEAPMRCGIGLCGSCEVGQGWLTCLDGPVFEFNPLEVSPLEAA